MLHIRKITKNEFWRLPVERTHGEIVILSLSGGKLLLEVLEAVELAAGIKLFIIFSVAAFDLSVVPWSKGPDPLVPDTELLQRLLKQGGLWIFCAGHRIGKFRTIVRLDALYGIRKFLYHILQKLHRRICAVLFVSLEDPEAAVLVNEGILIIFLLCRFTYEAALWNKFHINLAFLTRMCHLFVRFRDVFRIWKLDRLTVNPTQDLIQSGDGTGVATLTELDPEHHQTGVRVPAAHILNELHLGICVLVGMAVGPVRAVRQGADAAVILFAPAVDVLPGGFVVLRCLCDAFFVRITNYCLLKPHILCYLIHSE